MPRPVTFRAGSVVYFAGDSDERIYILKSGRIILKSKDLETGQDITDVVQTGEFFGVKSSLGRFPREEDALVLTDAQCVVFSVPEFEQFVSSNTRIIIKMLKVFSNQLRRIHSKVSSMLNTREEVDAEAGLFKSAEYYLTHKQYGHSAYILKRYVELYPAGRYIKQVKEYLSKAGQYAKAYGDAPAATNAPAGKNLSDAGKRYFEGESLYANEKFEEARKAFQSVLDDYDEGEYTLKARFEIGRCLFGAKDYAGTIRHFSALAQQVPKLPMMGELLLFIGRSYAETGDKAKAKAFLSRAATTVKDDPALSRKIATAVKELGV